MCSYQLFIDVTINYNIFSVPAVFPSDITINYDIFSGNLSLYDFLLGVHLPNMATKFINFFYSNTSDCAVWRRFAHGEERN
jgi:hypothetical protein